MKTTQIIIILILALLFCLSDTADAQNGRRKAFKEHRQKIEAHKVAFLTDKLDLSPEEAEKFWPVYNQHNDLIAAEQKAFREKFDISSENISDLGDAEALSYIDAQLDHHQKILNYRKEFNEELKKVLSPQKILILIESEKQFREKLIREVAGRRGPQGPGRR